MTSIEKLHAQLKAVQERRAQIFEQIKPLQDQALALYADIQKINAEITQETLKTEQTEQECFDFLMDEDGGSSDQLRYDSANKLIRSMGLYMSGYCPFSKQRLADVFVFKFDDARNVQSIASIKKLIELFKPMDEEGNKYFKIFCTGDTIVVDKEGKLSLQNAFDKTDFKTLELLFAHYVKYCTCYDEDDDSEEGED